MQVWPGITVFPDFTDINKSLPYWIKYIKYFYEEEGIKVDGLWIVSVNTVISNNNTLQNIKRRNIEQSMIIFPFRMLTQLHSYYVDE